MAIAAYDSDLTSSNSGEIAVANTVTDGGTWDESSNATWDDAGAPGDEANKYINNTNCISAQFTKAGQGTIIYDSGSTASVDTDGAVLIWSFWDSPPSLSTYANGGVKILAGSGVGDFYAWDCGGSDFEPSPYASWYCYAINPNFAASTIPYDDQVGTPGSAPYDTFGMAINASAQARGYPFAVNAIRVGRCTLEVIEGQASAYGTFTGMATFDLSTNQRYGLFYPIPGSGAYRWQGLMKLGTTTAVDFRDGNVSIAVANTPNVTANFNLIQINNSGSNVAWTNVIMTSPGVNDSIATTASRGDFNVVDNATVALVGCSFTDMGYFTFNAGTNDNTIDGTTFRRCDLITTGGASFDGCTFDDTNDSAKAMIVSSPANAALITNSTFTSGGTGHAIEIGGTAANVTLTGLDFSGYDTSDPGTAANKAIFVNIATGTMTINISGGSGVSEDYHVRSAGATVTVSADVTVTFAGMKDNTEVRVYKTSDDSVVDGIEDATAGTTNSRTFAWSAPATTSVYYKIHNFENGVPMYQTISKYGYIVPANDTEVEINQVVDRNVE